MIPKTIHYCWFGRNPKPKLALKCIESWKRFCPDYEIMEWNEDNFDLSCNPFVEEAYSTKKWAFVTDYVRLWAIYSMGGVYMDTDVELVNPIDSFLHHQAFSGFESPQHVPTGLMGGEKNHPVYGELLRYYDDRHFIRSDGELDVTTNTKIITSMMKAKGLLCDNTYQEIDGFAFYPTEFFCPKDPSTGIIAATKNTHAIHHFDASWVPPDQKKLREEYWKEVKRERRRHLPNRIAIRLLGQERYDQVKTLLGR